MDLKAISTIRVYLIHKVEPCLATLRIINRKDSLQTWFDLNLLRLGLNFTFFLFLLNRVFTVRPMFYRVCFSVPTCLFNIEWFLCVIHIHKLSLLVYLNRSHPTSSSSSGYSSLLVPIAHSFSWQISCISHVIYKQVNYWAVAGLLMVHIHKWQVVSFLKTCLMLKKYWSDILKFKV